MPTDVGPPVPGAAPILASIGALVVAAEFFVAFQVGALPWNGQRELLGPTTMALALIAFCGVARPWVGSKRHDAFALLVSVAMGTLVVRMLVLVAIGFAWLCSRVSRLGWPTWQKLTFLLAAWLFVTVERGLAPSGPVFAYGPFFLYWACLPTAVICLVVERSRGRLEGATLLQDATYLLALPRFFLPFLQPIGVRKFLDSRRPPSGRLALRAAGLGALAVACMFAMSRLHYQVRAAGVVHVPHVALHVLNNGLLVYVVNASMIFGAVALFRTLGYDLGSGFRFPLLATSFGDLYRRWNYYFFEFVSENLFLPLISAWRRRLPLGLAYLAAGYVSIALGVWAVDNFVFQIGVFGLGPQVAHEVTDVTDLAVHGLIWSLIIIPPLVLSRARHLKARRWWRSLSHAATLLVGGAVLLLLYWFGIALY